MVAETQIRHVVRGDHDCSSAVRESPQCMHDGLIEARIKTRCGLVEKQQGGSREQLKGDRGSLALATG